MDVVGHVVVEEGEGNPVLGTNGLPNDNLIDIIELVPILIPENKQNLFEELVRNVYYGFIVHIETMRKT